MAIPGGRGSGTKRLVAVVGLLFAAAATAQQSVPDWTLPDETGAPLNFYEHSAGQPAVLLFWASWCPYCRQLMPGLDELRREFTDTGVTFYALNVWEDGDPIGYFKKNGFGFKLLRDADEVAKIYGIKGTPGLIVVDAERRVVYVRKSGAPPAAVVRDLRAILRRLYAAGDSGPT